MPFGVECVDSRFLCWFCLLVPSRIAVFRASLLDRQSVLTVDASPKFRPHGAVETVLRTYRMRVRVFLLLTYVRARLGNSSVFCNIMFAAAHELKALKTR